MTMTQTEIDGFNAKLKDVLPRLRVYALSLTRDRNRADNLVQQTALKALAGRELFRPGTNFGGWIFRIERNEFISELRRTRPTGQIADADAKLSVPPTQESGLVMREFMAAFRKLSRGSRQALLLAKLEGQSYEQIASHAGVAVGTVKSRIWRSRAALERLLAGKAVGDDRGRTVGAALSARPPAPEPAKELSSSPRQFEHRGKALGHVGSQASRSATTSHQGAAA